MEGTAATPDRPRRELPLGWCTDLAVLEHGGSGLDDHGDHIVVRTPDNPTFHWGNCLLVTDPDAVDDAERWVGTFRQAFPAANWVAIGLLRRPGNPAGWTRQGLELETDEVLAATSVPREAPLAPGYSVRPLAGGDGEQVIALELAETARTGRWEPTAYEPFARARMRTQQALSERGVAAFFGAFADGVLVARLGIVRCGATARYQSVMTDERHRRRGLASNLLGVAGRWAAEGGCERWVIMTETTNPAGQVYRRAGLEPVTTNVQAYRRSAR